MKSETANQATRILDKFKSRVQVAILLDESPQMINSWVKSGYIPAKHHDRLLAAGMACGAELEPSDFFDPELIQKYRLYLALHD